jgi:hypothetical protein
VWATGTWPQHVLKPSRSAYHQSLSEWMCGLHSLPQFLIVLLQSGKVAPGSEWQWIHLSNIPRNRTRCFLFLLWWWRGKPLPGQECRCSNLHL